MPTVAAASNTTSGFGVGIEPSGVQSSSDRSGAWPVGAARPAPSSAVRISLGRRTKSNASTFFKPISASRASDPLMSAANCSARVYSCTEAVGEGHVVLLSSRRHYRAPAGARITQPTGPVIVSAVPQETQPEDLILTRFCRRSPLGLKAERAGRAEQGRHRRCPTTRPATRSHSDTGSKNCTATPAVFDRRATRPRPTRI